MTFVAFVFMRPTSTIRNWENTTLHGRTYAPLTDMFDKHTHVFQEKSKKAAKHDKKAARPKPYSGRGKSAREARAEEDEAAAPPSIDLRFDAWQNEMAHAVIAEGQDLVVDAATATGKTFASLIITGHLVLQSDEATGLIVAPNVSVLLEMLSFMQREFKKKYEFASSTMIGTQSYTKCSWTDTSPPPCQIVLLTSGNLVKFMTNPLNASWLKRMRVAMFDEAHLSYVTRAIWWLSLLDLRECRFIVLSATLGDAGEAIRSLDLVRPGKVKKLVQLRIRPVPIQTLLVNSEMSVSMAGLETCYREDFNAETDIRAVINWRDPSWRDTLVLRRLASGEGTPSTEFLIQQSERRADNPYMPTEEMEWGSDRVRQYEEARSLVGTVAPIAIRGYTERLQSHIRDTPTTATMLVATMQRLFVRDMAPLLIFNPSPSAVEDLAVSLCDELERLESIDPEFLDAQSRHSKMKEAEERMNEAMASLTEKQSMRPPSELHRLLREKHGVDPGYKTAYGTFEHLKKWTLGMPDTKLENKYTVTRGRRAFDRTEKPVEWIMRLYRRGIGIYTSDIPGWIRNIMLDCYKKRQLRVLFSDSELCVGVNLPTRTVITVGDIDKATFVQISGRAGRRGIDTQGYVVPLAAASTIWTLLDASEVPTNMVMKSQVNHMDVLTLHHILPLEGISVPKQHILPDLRIEMHERMRDRMTVAQQMSYELKLIVLTRSRMLAEPLTTNIIDFDEPRALYWYSMLRRGLLHGFDMRKLLWLACYIWGSEGSEGEPSLWDDSPFDNLTTIRDILDDIKLELLLPKLPVRPSRTVYRHILHRDACPPLLRLELEEIKMAMQILTRMTRLAPPTDTYRHALGEVARVMDHGRSKKNISQEDSDILDITHA